MVYAVVWDEPRFIKIGLSSTTYPRWRAFVRRGGRLVALWSFVRGVDAVQFEADAHRMFSAAAFASASEAEPYLGSRGAGWVECFRLDQAAVDRMLNTTPAGLRKLIRHGHSGSDSAPDLLRTYGRTDGLTENQLTHRSHGSSSEPRARVRRIESDLALSTGRSLRDQATRSPDPDAEMVMAVLNASRQPLTTERLLAAARAYEALKSSRERIASFEAPKQEAHHHDQEEPAA
jgi:hypothetical protein